MSESAVVPMIDPESDTPKLVIEARVREKLPQAFKVSSEFLDELNRQVLQLVADAVVACKGDNRNTLKARDVHTAADRRVHELKIVIQSALDSIHG